MIISSLMFEWYEFPIIVIYSPLFTPIIVRYLKTFIYLLPWKYSYWNYKSRIQPMILKFETTSEFDREIFSDFISGNKVARGASGPTIGVSYDGYTWRPASRDMYKISVYFFALIFWFHSKLKQAATANQGANFEGKSKILWFFVAFSIYDPFYNGIKETYRFSKLVSYIDFLDEDKSKFVMNMYSSIKAKNVKRKPADLVTYVLSSTTSWKPEKYPGLRESFKEYKRYIIESSLFVS